MNIQSPSRLLVAVVIAAALASPALVASEELAVNITPDVGKVEITKDGKTHVIMRNQDEENTVNPAFAKTSRKCPPFCIQPAQLAPGVETIGEVEMIGYLKQMSDGDDSILVVDSRTPDWVSRGTIPGAVNIPWTALNPEKGADPLSIGEIMTSQFNVKELEGLWDYSECKTLVMFCNGMWCGQSPNNIQNLLAFGYPAHKIKWYRGGCRTGKFSGCRQ